VGPAKHIAEELMDAGLEAEHYYVTVSDKAPQHRGERSRPRPQGQKIGRNGRSSQQRRCQGDETELVRQAQEKTRTEQEGGRKGNCSWFSFA